MNLQSTMQETLATLLIKYPLCRKSRGSKLFSSNVKVMFCNFNMILLIQPLDQGMIPTLSVHYLRKVLNGLINETENNKMMVKNFWGLSPSMIPKLLMHKRSL
jgi:hypothetical protein